MGIRGQLECLGQIFLGAERRRERIDDEGDDDDADERKHVHLDHGEERESSPYARSHGAEHAAEKDHADEQCHRRDGGEDHDVSEIDLLDGQRFRGDLRPFLFGCQQYAFDAFHEIHAFSFVSARPWRTLQIPPPVDRANSPTSERQAWLTTYSEWSPLASLLLASLTR